MPKAPHPTKVLKFNGHMEYPIDKGLDDWGLNPEEQETCVEEYRLLLTSKNAWREDEHDFYKLRRFLRARTYDLENATKMWMAHLKWRQELKVDTVLHDFEYTEKEAFLAVYPQGYHKTDKEGRPVYIQNIGKIDITAIKKATSEERMIRFHIQEYERCVKVVMPICSKRENRNIDTTFGIMDVKGVGMAHLSGEVKRLLGVITQTDQDNYPEMLGHICIINAPYVFRLVWAAIKGLLDVRTQGKIEILGYDYTKALLHWVDAENLPVFLGGKSQGSLMDDVGPWSDPAVIAELGIDVDAMRDAPPYRGPHHNGAPAAGGGGGAAGDGAAHHAAAAGDGSATPPQGVSGELPAHSLARVPSSTVSETGYYSPSGSISEFSRTSSLRKVLVEVNGGTHDTPSISERPRTLVERVQAVESLLPAHSRRLAAHLTNGGAAVSAPEGSLLQRVEVLEAAMESLLSAQQVALQQAATQQPQDGPARPARPAEPKPEDGGCCSCCCVQ